VQCMNIRFGLPESMGFLPASIQAPAVSGGVA